MKQSINFNWKFIDNYKEEYLKDLPDESKIVNIPHTFKELPYNYFNDKCYQFIGTYEKYFDINENIENKIILIRFEAFMLKAKIYLNNNYLGEFVSLYLPVEIDITNYVKQNNNKLLVILDSSEDENYPPFGYAVDYLTFSGIYREVSIITHNSTYLYNIHVDGDMNGNINVSYNVNGKEKISITHELYFLDELIKVSSKNNFQINNHKLWDIDNPNLYTLKTILKTYDKEEVYFNKFGFRSIKFDKTGFYLNDKKIKLLGLNRHQSYPYVGYAMPSSIQEDDANILKFKAGVNVVRTSHYPQSEHFLNRCDEIGLLVINEIPGWQFISSSKIWRDQFYINVTKMINKEYNHPSLIAHGIRIDESKDDHELYLKANEIAHSIDKTRPTLGVRNFINSELLEDIYAYNDFTCENLKKGVTNPSFIKRGKSPYLITEYMGHMEPTKATSDEENKIHHALRHACVINNSNKYERISGCIGWCFVDYYTHEDFGSGDHICHHGVFDMFRNPKKAMHIYSSQQDNFPVFEVLSNMKPGDFPKATYKDIYLATNADYVELYKNDKYVTTFKPNHKEFKYLKHPPIFVDDIVGETFTDPRLKKEKERKKLAKILSYVSIHSFKKIKISQLLTLGKAMLKYKLKYQDLIDIWNEHCASWGGKAKKFTFKAYKDNKCFKEQSIGPSTFYTLKYKLSKNSLEIKDTYDALRISLKYVDEFDNVCSYAHKVVEIKKEGPIEIIGPSLIPLLNGEASIYIKSLDKKGTGKIIITCENITKEILININ